MALLTTLEKLENIQTAIINAENAIAVSEGDTSVQRAKLETLYEREKYLLEQYNRENGNYPGYAINQGIIRR